MALTAVKVSIVGENRLSGHGFHFLRALDRTQSCQLRTSFQYTTPTEFRRRDENSFNHRN